VETVSQNLQPNWDVICGVAGWHRVTFVRCFCIAAEWTDERTATRSQAARIFWSTDRSCSRKVLF